MTRAQQRQSFERMRTLYNAEICKIVTPKTQSLRTCVHREMNAFAGSEVSSTFSAQFSVSTRQGDVKNLPPASVACKIHGTR